MKRNTENTKRLADVVYELKDGVLIKNKVEDYHER